jgi:hypothetical protein
VTDPKSFEKFWGGEKFEDSAKVIAFVSPRKNGAFGHTLAATDWDLSEKSELSLTTQRYGIAAQTAGPGEGYSRYREDFRYNEWKKGISRPELAAAAP